MVDNTAELLVNEAFNRMFQDTVRKYNRGEFTFDIMGRGELEGPKLTMALRGLTCMRIKRQVMTS